MKTTKMLLCVILALLMALAPMCATAETIYLAKTKKTCAVYNGAGIAVDTLSAGEYVLCKGTESPNVMKVVSRSGKTGFVSTSKLKKKSSFDSKHIGLAKKSLTVYRIKNGQAYAVAKVSAGYPMLVTEVIAGIAHVKTLTGATGYVEASKLKHI